MKQSSLWRILVICGVICFLHQWLNSNSVVIVKNRDTKGLETVKTNVNLRLEIIKTRVQKSNQTGNFTCDLLPPNQHFVDMISKYAIGDVIVLAVTDLGLVELAENLYESSFKKFSIENYLFVCSHEKAEQYLASKGIHAVTLWNESKSINESLYNREGYVNKTHFKTITTYMSLCLGYTTLLTDVDIVFLRNPLPYLLNYSKGYDIVIQKEFSWINSGFYLAPSRGPAIEMHERMMLNHARAPRLDQQVLNDVMLREMKGKLRYKFLHYTLFPWTGYYVYQGKRQFAGDNRTDVTPYIFHSNLLFMTDSGLGAKRYRLREFLMWHVDTNGYYSSPDRKYITFELPVKMYDKPAQKRALIAGFQLATLTNRTLILPKFYCENVNTSNNHCNYQRRFGTVPFYLDRYEGVYREHMFLHHPLVPNSIKQSQSDTINVKVITRSNKGELNEQETNELLKTLKDYEHFSVIHLTNLHNVTIQKNSPLWRRFSGIG